MLTSVKLWDQGTNHYIFSRAFISMCTTTVPNFVLLTYPYPEIQAAEQKLAPLPEHARILIYTGVLGLKIFLLFLLNFLMVNLFRIKIEKT